MKIGAAAWITPASPESILVSANPRSQNGSALFSAPRTKQRPDVAAEPADAAADGEERQQHHEPDRETSEGDDGGLELVDPHLDEEERRAPDRREEEQQAEVASRHRVRP